MVVNISFLPFMLCFYPLNPSENSNNTFVNRIFKCYDNIIRNNLFHVKYFGTICSKILYMNKFSERISYLRHKKALTRIMLAEKLGVSVRQISYWECGQRECDFDMLLKIADLFGVSVDYLLGRSDY